MKQHWASRALAVLGLAGLALPAAAASVELTTRVSGVVDTVLVRPGQRVQKGAPLLRLDRTVLRARVAEAEAEYARAEADEADAKREAVRAQELFDRTVSSTTELEAATLRHARARAMLAAAEARRTIARKDLSDAELKAPFAGTVKAVPGGPGSVVTADCQPKPLVILEAAQR